MKTPHDARALIGLLLAITLLCALPILLSAVAPTWWTAQKVYRLDNGSVADALDYSAANQGQLKKMAVGAYEHMTKAIPFTYCKIWTLPGGTTSTNGEALRDLVRQWVEIDYNETDGSGTGKVKRKFLDDPNAPPAVNGTGDIAVAAGAANHRDFAAVTQGQLKAVAKVFYKRIEELYRTRDQLIQFPIPTPWRGGVPWTDDNSSLTTADTEDDENRALANLGQLKRAFKFDLMGDSDGDGKSDIDEIAAVVPPGGTPNNPFNADSDGDDLLDGDESGNNSYFTDSDGDGFKDGEDRWPNDGRRGDYIPPKFYALTDLSAYIPDELSAAKEPKAIIIDDESRVALYGITEDQTQAHVIVWNDGAVDATKSFGVPLGGSQFYTHGTNPDGSEFGVYATFSLTIAGLKPDGALNVTYKTGWEDGATRNPDGTISPGDAMYVEKAMLVAAPGTLPPLVEEHDWDDQLKGSYALKVSQGGVSLGVKREVITADGEFTNHVGLARLDDFIEELKWTRTADQSENPPAVSYSNVSYCVVGLPHQPHSFFRDSAVNDTWMSLVNPMNPRGDIYLEKHTYYESEGVAYANPRLGFYIYQAAEGGGSATLIEAPAGILAFNDQLQAVGCDPLPSGDPGPAFFAEYNTSTGDWFKTDLKNLLKWLNKPSGTKDDYDRYFGRSSSEDQIKDIVPKLLTNVDPSTAGFTIPAGSQNHTFANGYRGQ